MNMLVPTAVLLITSNARMSSLRMACLCRVRNSRVVHQRLLLTQSYRLFLLSSFTCSLRCNVSANICAVLTCSRSSDCLSFVDVCSDSPRRTPSLPKRFCFVTSCLQGLNILECGWDDGDCCECSNWEAISVTGKTFNCLEPDPQCLGELKRTVYSANYAGFPRKRQFQQ